MTLATNTGYLNMPSLDNGRIPVTNATMRVFLVIRHPMDAEGFMGDVRRVTPCAVVCVGEFHPVYDPQTAGFWMPSEGDLNDAGKFLLAMLLDCYPQHGAHKLTSTIAVHEYDELPIEALAELTLATAPVSGTVN